MIHRCQTEGRFEPDFRFGQSISCIICFSATSTTMIATKGEPKRDQQCLVSWFRNLTNRLLLLISLKLVKCVTNQQDYGQSTSSIADRREQPTE